MNGCPATFHLTPAARNLLHPGEALVFEWHRLAVCCAGAGETSLGVVREEAARRRKGLVRASADGEVPIYAARAIFPHLAGREVRIDARRFLGLRSFSPDLPKDFGLRSIFGRLSGPDEAARTDALRRGPARRSPRPCWRSGRSSRRSRPPQRRGR